MSRPTNALIVDDEAHLRTFLRFVLAELGIKTVWEAGDGREALRLVTEHRPELVLLDLNLPVMNGLEVLAAISDQHPGTPVVIVSSQNGAKTVLECRNLGAIAYVLKYGTRDQTRAALSATLDELENETEETSDEVEAQG